MRIRMAAVAAVLAAAGAAQAQSYNFELPTYAGAAAGVIITGVDGWYVPLVANSTDGKVYTYAGNALGFPANPGGGDQFQGGTGTGPSLLARAQHDIIFAAGGVWQVEYDFAGKWSGAALPAVDNIGSWSLQDSATTRGFQTLMTWGQTAVGPVPNATLHTATATNFHHAIGYYAVAPFTATVFATPSPAWRDLLVNNWYHARIKWDFTASKVLECSIQDITGAGAVQTTDVSANNWYLRGGPASVVPLPTGMRLFGGGAVAAAGSLANSCVFDNVSVGPVVVPCYPDCNGVGGLTIADFGCFQTRFVAQDPYADCNGVGGLTIADFGCFQTKFVAGCP